MPNFVTSKGRQRKSLDMSAISGTAPVPGKARDGSTLYSTPWIVSLEGRGREGGPGGDLHPGGRGHPREALLLPLADAQALDRDGGAEQRRDDLRLAERLFAPCAGDEVLRGRSLLQEVHRDLGEQRRGPSLEQEDFVACRHAEELADEGDRLVVDRFVLLPPVAVLHHRHAAPGEVEELVAGALQRGQGKGGGSGIEIDFPVHGVSSRGRAGDFRGSRRVCRPRAGSGSPAFSQGPAAASRVFSIRCD